MEIDFPKETYEAVRKERPKSPALQEKEAWHGKTVESRLILPDDYALIKRVVKQDAFWVLIENRRIHRKIESIEALRTKGKKKFKIKSLELLVEALRDVVGEATNKWVFKEERGRMTALPFFVSSIKYKTPTQGAEPRVIMALSAFARGEKTEDAVSFHKQDLCGTVYEVLDRKEVVLASEALVAEHAEALVKYEKVRAMIGEQYLGRGTAQKHGDGKWHWDEIVLEREGEPAKLIIDDAIGFGKNTPFYSTSFWVTPDGDEEDDERAETYRLPVHPVVRAFDLGHHEFVTVHSDQVEEYVYDPKMVEKIVLPDEHARLIEALTTGTVRRMDDIVRGKARGAIIVCTGKPGTGKTLTAEVYSEVAARPLYTVQCSQLGTDPEKLEENLAQVLERATRWRAILLIDEADVYIHERGTDVGQNAIVGVFLRLLEYYNGILFMNTNREEVIDDAILSRATAHIKYEAPDDGRSRRIWSILSRQYRVDLDETHIGECMRRWPGISGRAIRQIVRLGRMVADRDGRKVTMDDLVFAASFQDLS